MMLYKLPKLHCSKTESRAYRLHWRWKLWNSLLFNLGPRQHDGYGT